MKVKIERDTTGAEYWLETKDLLLENPSRIINMPEEKVWYIQWLEKENKEVQEYLECLYNEGR